MMLFSATLDLDPFIPGWLAIVLLTMLNYHGSFNTRLHCNVLCLCSWWRLYLGVALIKQIELPHTAIVAVSRSFLIQIVFVCLVLLNVTLLAFRCWIQVLDLQFLLFCIGMRWHRLVLKRTLSKLKQRWRDSLWANSITSTRQHVLRNHR